MEYPSLSPALRIPKVLPGRYGDQQPHFSDNKPAVHFGLAADTVSFSGRSRVQESAKAKRALQQRQHKKQADAILELEKASTRLYDQQLHIDDPKAFQAGLIEALSVHPELPMDINIRPDLELERPRAIPLLHFALANQYFELVDYMFARDERFDFSRQDYKNRTARELAQSVAEEAMQSTSLDVQQVEDCERYAGLIRRKTIEHQNKHPEKYVKLESRQPASTAISLKGYSQQELSEFLKAHGVPDSDNEAEEKPAGITGSEPLPGEAVHKKTKKQIQAEKRQKAAQMEKDRKSSMAQQKEAEIEERLSRISLLARAQELEQAEKEKREALERYYEKARELNTRLDALPEMDVPKSWLEQIQNELASGEWQKVGKKTASKKVPQQTSFPAKKEKGTQPSRLEQNKATEHDSERQGPSPVKTTKKPIPLNVDPAVPIVSKAQMDQTEVDSMSVKPFLPDADQPVVNLPTQPVMSPTFSLRTSSTMETRDTQATGTFSTTSSKQSTNTLISKLKRQRDEKQRLLVEASLFSMKQQALTFQERQTLRSQAVDAFRRASDALEQAQHLRHEKKSAEQYAQYWKDEAVLKDGLLQQALQEQALQQQELNTLKAAFNAQRNDLGTMQTERKTALVSVNQYEERHAAALKVEECAIEALEGLQQDIQEREAVKKSPFSKNPDDYAPCSEGGYRIQRGFGQGSWIPKIPG